MNESATATDDKLDQIRTETDAEAHESSPGDDTAYYDDDELYVQGIIKNHVITAMGLGLLPVPVFDVVSIVAVQMNMVHRLGDAYDVPFRKNAVRSSILTLIGGVLPTSLGVVATSYLKLIPGLGSLAGAAGTVVLAGALTYAIGQVFDRHLSSGGDFLNLDIASAKKLFRQKFSEGKTLAAKLRKRS